MKKTFFWVTIMIIVIVIAVAIFIPPFLRYTSYNNFLDRIDAVKTLKVGNFVIDPLELQIKTVHGYYTSAIDPSKVGNNSEDIIVVNIFPVTSVRYKKLKDNLEKRLGGFDEVNGIKGCPMETFKKFYDKTNKITALVTVQYALKKNKNSVILYPISSPIEFVIEDNPNTSIQTNIKILRENILNDLKESKTNIDEQISVYSGRGIIVSILCFTPKSDNLSEAQSLAIVNAEKQFNLGLLKIICGEEKRK